MPMPEREGDRAPAELGKRDALSLSLLLRLAVHVLVERYLGPDHDNTVASSVIISKPRTQASRCGQRQVSTVAVASARAARRRVVTAE